jgi:hypothetical protein
MEASNNSDILLLSKLKALSMMLLDGKLLCVQQQCGAAVGPAALLPHEGRVRPRPRLRALRRKQDGVGG